MTTLIGLVFFLHLVYDWCRDYRTKKELAEIKESFEKKISKKPIKEFLKSCKGEVCFVVYRCPECKRVVCFEGENDIENNYPYCECGQALDWSEE